MSQQIAIIGSGSIGPDLAYGFATALAPSGGTVLLHDISEKQLERGLQRIEGYLAKGVSRGKLSESAAARLRECLETTTNLSGLAGCSYVLEAATENLEIKQRILADLEGTVSADCLIGFATSGIPRRRIVARARHPERCFVNHPFYPAWRSLPIELVPSADPVSSKRMYDLLLRLGKVPVITSDVPCFAADDVFCNFECEAFRILQDGWATVPQIDRVIDEHIGGGGPFRVADLTAGNPLIAHCQELMAEDRTDGRWFQPPRILLEKGNTPWYEAGKSGGSDCDPALASRIMERIYAVVLSRSLAIVENGVCEPGDLDWLLRNSLGFRKGFLRLAREFGADRVRQLCQAYAASNPGFEVPASVWLGKLPQFPANVILSVDDHGIALLQVRRPEVVNALNRDTIRELTSAFQSLDRDPSVRGIIFGGLGGGLAGAEIGELAALETLEECAAICRGGHQLTLLMEGLSKPVVAAVDGPTLGAGAELCMAAWGRVVSQRSLIGQPEVNLGIIPGYGGTQRLPRLIGLERAAQLLRTGRPMTAREACEWGWASGQPVDDTVAEASRLLLMHLSGEIRLQPLNHSPLPAVDLPFSDIGHHSWKIDEILRDVLSAGLVRPLPEGLGLEAQGFGRCRLTRDMAIGMANFRQNGPRVPAVFIGR